MLRFLIINFELGSYPAIAPVTGRSGKIYGYSNYCDQRRCHVLEMTPEAYREAIKDILGNRVYHYIPDAIVTVEGAPLVAPEVQTRLEASGVVNPALTDDEIQNRLMATAPAPVADETDAYFELALRNIEELREMLPPGKLGISRKTANKKEIITELLRLKAPIPAHDPA